MTLLLLGCGQWGALILRELISMEVLVDVVDPSASALTAAKSIGARFTYDCLPESGDWNGIIVSTPASSHYHDVVSTCCYDLPIYVEKPMTVTSLSAKKLVQISNPKIFVMHTWRYHAGIEMLSRMIQNKGLGELCAIHSIRANWTSPRVDVDPVWTLLPHDLSILLEFFDEMPQLLSAEAEYRCDSLVAMKCSFLIGEVRIWITVSTRQIEKQREVQLHFEDGVVVLPDDVQGCLHVLKNDELPQQMKKVYYDLNKSALQSELDIFCRYLDGGAEPKCSASTGSLIVSMIEEIRRLAGCRDA